MEKKRGMQAQAAQWLEAAGIRAVKTMAQTAVSMLTVGQAVIEVNWVNVASVSLVAGGISILTSLAGLPELGQERGAQHDPDNI